MGKGKGKNQERKKHFVAKLYNLFMEHNEIPARFVTANPKVNSFSQCDACHIDAEQGSFNEHDVRIPGYGRWDDWPMIKVYLNHE